jgi:Carbohydrate esterase, sialic acid-specific acetylesterase
LRRSQVAIAIAASIALGALLYGVYWFGAYGYATQRWPATEFKSLRFALLQSLRSAGIDFDSTARLIAYPGKTTIACPEQTNRTAVFLIIGQSNAANSGGQRFPVKSGRVAAYFDGTCSVAASPLLGSSGVAGEPWSAVGDNLVTGGSFDDVVIIPAAVGGSRLSEWIGEGELRSMLKKTVEDAQKHYRITHVLWHQGEGDFSLRTSEDAYVSGFNSLAGDLRAWGVIAPIHVSVASHCGDGESWSPDNPVTRAQRRLASSGEGFKAGVDSDSLLDVLDRFDGCHMAGSGLTKVIDAWTEILGRK